MLKKSTYILLSLLLCVPLVFIVYFSLSINTEKPTNTTLMGVSVQNRDGYEFSYSDPEELELYLATVTNAKKIEKPIRDISGDTPTIVTYNELNEEYDYSFYLDTDTEECYFTDSNGVYYRIAKEQADSLVVRKEYAYLYSNYIVPTVTLSAPQGEFVYTADEGYEWKFKQGENFSDGFLSETSDNGIIAFGKDDTLSLSFSVAPTKCDVNVYNGEQAAHFGNNAESMAELPTKLTYTSDTPLVCEINAEWIATDEQSYHGKATYRAQLLYDIPMTYTVVDHRLSPGEFTIIKFENLNDDQIVTFSSSDVEKLPLAPTRIHSLGGKKFAFLPIDLSAKPGSYTINVIAGNEEKSFAFTVNSKAFPEAQIAQNHGTAAYEQSKTEFEAIVKSLSDQSVSERLWDDDKASGGTYKFANPVPSATNATPAFGARVIADTNLKSLTPYTQNGIILKAAEGTDVVATAAGKVVYAGELAYSGKAVIIDHGCNVLSIYQNLSEISVNVGDSVAIKSVIGKTGKTGYIFEAGTKFSMCMDGVYINPVSNYTYGIQVS